MNAEGQGPVEYLLLIAGIIVVAVIIIALVVAVPNTGPAPECSVECGNLPLAAIDREEACNNHAMEDPGMCGGNCLWEADQCVYEQ